MRLKKILIKSLAAICLITAATGICNTKEVGAKNENTATAVPVPVPITAPPKFTPDPNATIMPTKEPGPSEQYKLLERRTSSDGNYEYVLLGNDNKNVTITKIHNYADTINIPEQIDGFKVTMIGIPYEEEYDVETILKEEVLKLYPEDYEKGILKDAFIGVNYLRRCVIDYNDEKVVRLNIPEGVQRICQSAFGNMKSLQTLNMPESLRKIDINNFRQCEKLRELNFKGDISVYNSFAGVMLDKIRVSGSFTCGGGEDGPDGICGRTEVLEVDKKAFENAGIKSYLIRYYDLEVEEMIIPKKTYDVKSIYLDCPRVDRLTLANPKLTVIQDFSPKFDYLESNLTKVKSTYNKKTKKYTYKWKAITCKNRTYKADGSSVKTKKAKVSPKYTIYRKNTKGKYVKLKTVNKAKFTSNKKMKLKVVYILEQKITNN